MVRQFPDYEASRSTAMRRRIEVLEMRFGGGHVQRLPRFGGAHQLQEWSVFFSHRSPFEIEEIDRFLGSHGGATSFLWTPPQGTRGLYVCSSWQITPVTGDLASLTALFTESQS
jgi:phage-related protein